MSGHSKWAQIKRQKGAADAKRGQVFTKLANAISIAVAKGGGGGDPVSNFKLRLLIEKARSVNMPKENIERAIKRAESRESGDIEDVVYEAFGPAGVGLIIEAATDNKLRTAPEIKNILEKNGGTMASQGTVAYQFSQKGMLTVKKNHSLDDIFMLAADTGAEDVEEAGEKVLIYTKPEDLKKVKEALSLQLSIIDAELIRKPVVTVPILDKETASKVISIMDKLENLDDVQKVYSNFDIPDEFT
ncbi:MAG: hypothetical protein A3F31_03510 [Candidatus Levybacteria bacterium RIFCSPHIGHO2_12_FULL_38_12]|nr:MAG: hypothetical protein A2770_04815 [Candidatus Levybacteria bacterium RIFCSPHIGHO2_01_FULL_38_12]OGH21578.1 MAG: hypothetical protein A3D75_02440 [Candidatus Levybacteria bacterium RIFCSPHIGHO2_02_FULL_37_18]OGH22875.1 MAG: hypothetical protein A3F31_03510 [Candidatus Levybacteria bacterium RIFCSPHIGHO2_12_FULL_38_12]OGH34743.1 MAG: hypothetical protein A3A47_01120 [Candidatus Levybacteria bacterium RIFCSPLOWO2_01_FULL_37_20]OGH43590.1 MAG: hypothetical protein A3J14_03355 [Candidatus Lev